MVSFFHTCCKEWCELLTNYIKNIVLLGISQQKWLLDSLFIIKSIAFSLILRISHVHKKKKSCQQKFSTPFTVQKPTQKRYISCTFKGIFHVPPCKCMRWLVVYIEIKISDFQTKHWLTGIICTNPEPYSHRNRNLLSLQFIHVVSHYDLLLSIRERKVLAGLLRVGSYCNSILTSQ